MEYFILAVEYRVKRMQQVIEYDRKYISKKSRTIQCKQLSTHQLISIGICSFGIQFATAMQMAYMSSIFKFLGANSGSLPHLWLAAPITGFLVQPLIGQLSDNTNTRFGKRSPYLVSWGIVAFICFCLLPFASTLGMAVLLFLGCWF